MKNITSFKNINIKHTLITLILIFNINLTFSQVDLRTCGFNCTSNNYTLTDVYLSLSNVNGTPITNTTCTIGQVQQVYIYLNYSSNSNSSIHFARLNSDLKINGVNTFLNVLLGEIVPGSNKKLIYGPFNWTCGDELSLSNTIIAWKTNSNNDPGPNYTCGSYTNSQCDFTNSFIISKPLAVQFTYKACKVGTNTTVTFTSTTNGGKTPYTYAWDFRNDGGAPDSTSPNPTFTYTTSNNTAKLTVTDAQNLSNSYILSIIEPTELLLSETHTSVSCSGGTSNITLGVTGGTPGYSYLWNNGVTTKDLNNVTAGTYTVTVTDSNNCSKQLTVIIPSGDSIKPVIDPLPAVSTINCPQIPVFAQATATDNSGVVASLTYVDQTTPGSCNGSYTTIRTWTAKDACNNISLPVSQTINVVDITAPIWTTASGSLNQTIECSNTQALASAQALFPSASDLCDADVSNITKVSGQFVALEGCGNSGTYTNTWTVKDDCGNTSDTFTQVITIQDTTAPTWTTQAGSLNQTIECSNNQALTSAQALFPTASDLCDADVSNITKVSGQFVASEGCGNAGTYTNTWTVKDDCGNTSDTFTQVITIQDTTAPAWTTQAGSLNVSLECSDTSGLDAAQTMFPAAADLCDADVSNIIKVSGQFVASEGCGDAGTYTNTWTVKDDCGNTSDTFTQVITIQDTTAPTWTTQAGSLNVTLECSDTSGLDTAQALFPAAIDACDCDVTNITKVSGQFVASEGCGNSGTYTNTWTVKDDCGNTSDVFTQIITIQDTTAPNWTTQAGSLNQTIECSNTSGLDAAQALFPTASDLCDTDVSNITKVSGQFVASEGCGNSGTYTNTWTVKDDCGNTSDTFTQIITIQDTTAPAWTTQANSLNQTIECSNTSGLDAAQALFPSASDLCDADVSNITKVSGQFVALEGCGNSGTYTNTWTVKDDCGNTSDTFTQIITIQDTTAPAWTTQAGSLNQTIECSNAEALTSAQALFPSASDLCDADVSNITKVSGQFVASEGCSNSGTYTNTWTVKDDCGNTSDTFTQIITIQDTTAPAWTTQAGSLNQTIECSNVEALTSAQALFPSASDLCDADVSNITKVSGQFVASEGCGNAGTYTNTWSLKDDCGNTSDTFTQIITIQDTTAPTWTTQTGSLNQTIECSNVEALTSAQALFPTASDLCDADVSNITKVSGQFVASEGCANSGTYTNTWTVKDDCGNTSDVFTQIITIQDTTAPTWTTQAGSLNQTIECSNTEALTSAQALFPTASDLCDVDVSNITKVSEQFVASEGCSNSGTYTNTWTVTDDCGNTSDTFTQIITIQDTTAPAWTTQAGSLNQTIECSNAEALTSAQALFPTASDLCDADVSNITKVSGQFVALEGCGNSGTYTNTWTVKDDCGNTSDTFTQIITIQDSTAPAWTTQAGSLNQTIECSNAEALNSAQALFPTASDLCDADVSNITKVSGQFVALEGCGNSGTYTNTWTVKDDCGNTSDTFTQIITIQDTTAPAWTTQTGSLNQTIECSNAEALTSAQALFPSASDLCDADVSNITKVSGQFMASEGCANSGTYTNTWTVKDDCGNTSDVFTQIITIQDTTAPTWTTQAGSLNQTIECSNAEALTSAQALFPTASDSCDADVSNITKVSGQFVASEGCSNSGTYTNTWTVKDDCGNISDTFTQIITIQDTTAPAWTTQNGSLNQTIECSNTSGLDAAQALFPAASDLCDVDVSNITKVSGQFVASEGCSNSGTYTNTWTVTDDCGNTSDTFTQIITIQDTTAPAWTTQAGSLNQTIECSNAEALNSAQALFPTASDLCDTDVSNITKVSGQFVASEGCGNAGTYTNTWTVKDDCGNTSDVFTQVITIQDTTAPTWTTQAGSLNQTIECSNAEALTSAQALFPSATDLCDADVSNITKVSGQFVASEGCGNSGTYTNTWTVKDDCGNTSDTFTQIITIQDTTAPAWTTQANSLNQTIECSNTSGLDAAQALFPAASDLCDADVSNITKVSGQFLASEGCSNSGTYTNTWTVKDDCGNTSDVFTQVITIQDTTAPTWTTQSGSLNQTIECSNTSGLDAAQALFPSASDLCDADVSNITKVSGQFVALEGCGNSGTYTNTWTVKDDCGNTSDTFTQIITIQDTTAPTWTTQTGSLNQTIECNNAEALTSAQALFPSAIDLCDADVSNITKVSGQFVTLEGCVNSGTYTNTWTVKDDCGNTSDTFTQVITIQDTTAPTWTTQAGFLNQTIECSNAEALTSAQALFPSASDSCDTDVSNITKVSGQFVASEGCGNAGTYTNTWTVKDDCGNTSDTFTQIITIQDTTSPTWTTQADSLNQTIECSNAEALISAQALFPAASDSCDTDVSNITKVSGQFIASEGCGNSGTYTNTWTVKDDCGNTSDTFTQVITIQDTTAPTWTTQAGSLNQTIECSNQEALTSAQALLPNASDSCDNDVSNITKVSGQFVASEGCGNAGTYTNTWTVKDVCGNTSDTFTQIITIQDTTAPTWTTQSGSLNQTIECSNAEALTSAQALFPTASDSCDADVSNITKVSGQFVASEGCANSGTYTNTWTVKDDCGNTSDTFTQVITIQDTTTPTWTTQTGSLDITLQCADTEGFNNAQTQAPIATDNCNGTVTYTKTTGELQRGSCGSTGTYTNTWTAKDSCNNTSATFTQVITIQDTAAPTWITQAGTLNVTLQCSDSAGLENAQNQAPTATANCTVVTYEKTSGQFTASEGCGNSGTYTNSWIAKDDCGNVTDSFIQIITIQDNTAPTWTTQAGSLNQTIECSNAEALTSAQALFPAASDLCDADVSNITKVSGQFVASEGCSNSGTYTNTWTVKDDCGNTSDVFTQIITIQDNTAPTWTTQAGSLNQTIECSNAEALTSAQALFPAASDLCDADVSNITKVSGQFVASEGCSNSGTYTNTWTVKDDCGNTSDTFTQVITIQDTTAPAFTGDLPTDITVSCDAVPEPANIEASDNCSGDLPIVFSEIKSNILNECGTDYTLTRKWTTSDCGGSTVSHTQIITVRDTTPPTGTPPADIADLQSITDIPAANPQAIIDAADNCSSTVTVTISDSNNGASGCNGDAYILTRTYTLTDCSGNKTELVQTFTVENKVSVTGVASNVTCFGKSDGSILVTNSPGSTVVITNDKNEVVGNTNLPAGTYTLTATFAVNGENQTCTATTTVVITQPEYTVKISGYVMNVDNNSGIANVMVTLIPQGTTTGPILLRLTGTDGSYSFTGMPAGSYLVQVQDANLNSVYELYPINSSLFFTTLEDCIFQEHTFNYGSSTLPVLGDYVWYDTNSNGIQDEWYDANNDGVVTKNVPDSGGTIDYSLWEWIDLNGDGSYQGPLNVGELNAGGFGNAASPNVIVDGPNGYHQEVIIGIQGYWRDRPNTENPYGEYTIKLVKDGNLDTMAAALGATGLVKVLPNLADKKATAKTSKTQMHTVCSTTSPSSYIVNVTPQDLVHLDNDFGISCKEYQDIVANDDSAGPIAGVNHTTTNVLNVLINDTLEGNAVTVSDVIITTVTPNEFLQLNPDGSVDVLPNAPVGTLTLVYQICEADQTSNCDTATVTITIEAPVMTVTATPICVNDVPYIDYVVTPGNFTPVNGVTIAWANAQNTVITTMTNLPLSGRVLWPGAVVNEAGNGIDWPGWIFENNKWVQGADGFESLRPTVNLTISVNPSETITVNYPPADPYCIARPTFAIVANDDNPPAITAPAGVTNIVNVYNNDTLNNDPVNPADVTLTTVTPDPTNTLTLNPDGSVDVAANTPAGTYTLTYQICENADAGNCDTAIVTVIIVEPAPPTPVVANDDVYANIGCNTFGLVGNVLSNDFKGQLPATLELVNFTLLAENENNAKTDPNITIDNQGNVTVSSLTPAGTYTYTYRICDKLSAENCDTASVTITVVPNGIVNITSEACNDDSSLINLSNLLPEGTPITGTWIDTNETNALQGNIFNPFGLTLGNYTFEYKITDENCPRSVQLNMEVNNDCHVLACGNIVIHNAFSPNGDGINDVFVIDSINDLTCYPENTVEIYNRWGILVFETSNYNNTTNAFDGTSRGRTTVNKSDGLPSGTYFYILTYKSLNGNNEIQNNKEDGYLYLSK